MHALFIAVFLMGASAVMAAPAQNDMPRTIGDVVSSDGSSYAVAAFNGFLADTEHAEPMDGRDADGWDDENDGDNDDDGKWDDHGKREDDAGSESAAEVDGSADDVEDGMPSSATYEMSYDANASREADLSDDGDDGDHDDGDDDGDDGDDGDHDDHDDGDDVDHDDMPDNAATDGGAETMPADAPANTAATPAAEEMNCTVSAEGYSPKELTVKPGTNIKFRVAGEGEYSVQQSSGPTSCEPMAGGFSSKSMLNGDDDWTYTVPKNATGKMYVYSGPADKCDTTMMATITVADNLIVNTKSPSAANARNTLGFSSAAGSIAPALGSLAAAAVVAARTLF